MSAELAECVATLPLVDHHVHSALAHPVSRSEFEGLITESDRPFPPETTPFDSQVGFAIRRHCAEILGLPPHCSPDEYWHARAAHTPEELTRLFLSSSGVEDWLVDTGLAGDQLLSFDSLKTRVSARFAEIVRLEALFEQVAQKSTASGLERDFASALASVVPSAVGLKSIIAYRHGFDIDPAPPSAFEVRQAAGNWLRERDRGSAPRVTDPILLRMLLWKGVETGLPLQLHAGFGDPDLDLRLCDPLLLTPWLREIESSDTTVILLHCYPYHRNAAYLAHAFAHVSFDIGLAVNYTGAASTRVLAESLELAPFSKVLYSSDACGPPELHYLGAALWRRGITQTLTRWVDEGEWSEADAIRVATMIGRTNARKLYGLAHD